MVLRPVYRRGIPGKVSGWENRMGPYNSREEAEHAIEIAQARTAAADAEDAAEDDN